MNTITERLKNSDTLLCDGAIGTMLFERGLKAGECPETINLKNPDLLSEIAAMYLEAGSDIIATNTFGGSPLKLAQYELDGQTEQVNRVGVRAVRDAVGDKVHLAGVVGPCGKLLKPYGDTDATEVSDGFKRQIEAMLEEGIDIILIETMTDLSEALIALETAKRLTSSIPVSVSMTFDITPRGPYTIMGNDVKQVCQSLKEAGANLIGSNCGKGIESMIKIATEYVRFTNLPTIFQSNAGIPDMRGDKAVFPETPEFMAEKSLKLLNLGVRIVGGCCGTTPEHISALRATVDSYKSN